MSAKFRLICAAMWLRTAPSQAATLTVTTVTVLGQDRTRANS